MSDVLRYQAPFWVLFLAMLFDRLTNYVQRGLKFFLISRAWSEFGFS